MTLNPWARARKADKRSDELLAAARYAVTLGLEAAHWLEDWIHGDAEAMRELDEWRAKEGNHL